MDQIFNIFETNGESDQVIRDTEFLSDLRGDREMGHDSGAFNKGFNTTERFSQSHGLHGGQELSGFFDLSLDEEGDHTSEASHLLLSNFVLRVAGKTRVDDFLNLRVAFEEFSNDLSASASSIHSDLQGLETSESKVAVESTGSSSNSLGSEEELVSEGSIVGSESTHNDIGVTTDVFGDGVDTDVRAQKKGALEIRRGESVISGSDNSLGLGNLADGFNIADLKGRVGGGFNPDELSVGLNGLFNIFDIGHVNKTVFNTVSLLTDLSHISLGTSVDIIAANNVITNTKDGLDDASSSSTTTGEGHTVLSVLSSGQCDFKGFSGGVTATRIVELSERFTRELLGVGGRKVNGDADTSGNWIRFLTSVDGVGSETSMLLDEVRVFVLLDEFLGFVGQASFGGNVMVLVFHV